MKILVASFLLSLCLLTSCQSAALRRTALAHGATARDILAEQVLANLVELHDDPHALPTHIRVTSGQSQVNSNASLTGVANLVAGTDAYQTGSALGRSWTMNWNIVPVTDPLELERLHVLYRLVILRARMGTTAPMARVLGRLFEECTGQSCEVGDETTYRRLLLALFSYRRDAMGRPTNIDWELKTQPERRDDTNAAQGRAGTDTRRRIDLEDDRDPRFLATVVDEAEQWKRVENKLKAVPFDFVRFEAADGRPTIDRRTRGFRTFVLLTQQPDLSTAIAAPTGSGANAEEKHFLIPGPERAPHLLIPTGPVLDPGR